MHKGAVMHNSWPIVVKLEKVDEKDKEQEEEEEEKRFTTYDQSCGTVVTSF